MFLAGPPLTELRQIGRGPTIDGLAERLVRRAADQPAYR